MRMRVRPAAAVLSHIFCVGDIQTLLPTRIGLIGVPGSDGPLLQADSVIAARIAVARTRAQETRDRGPRWVRDVLMVSTFLSQAWLPWWPESYRFVKTVTDCQEAPNALRQMPIRPGVRPVRGGVIRRDDVAALAR